MQVEKVGFEGTSHIGNKTEKKPSHHPALDLFASIVLPPPDTDLKLTGMYSSAVEKILPVITAKIYSVDLISSIKNILNISINVCKANDDEVESIISFITDVFTDFNPSEEKDFRRFFGMFSYMAAHHLSFLQEILHDTSEKAIDEIYAQYEQILKQIESEAEAVRKAHLDAPLQDSNKAYISKLAYLAADHLVLPNNTINKGVLHELKMRLPEMRTRSEEHFFKVLEKLETDEELIQVIEQVDVKPDTPLSSLSLIRLVVGKMPCDPVTKQDTVVTLLSGLFHLTTDQNTDHSFSEAFILHIAETNLIALAKDYRQLIEEGKKQFPALTNEEAPNFQLKDKSLSLTANIYRDVPLPPGILRACHYLNLDESAFQLAWERIDHSDSMVKDFLKELGLIAYDKRVFPEWKRPEEIAQIAYNVYLGEMIHPLQRAWDEVTASALNYDLKMSPYKMYSGYYKIYGNEFHQKGNQGDASLILSWTISIIKKHDLHTIDRFQRIVTAPDKLLILTPDTKTLRRYFSKLKRKKVDAVLINAWFYPKINKVAESEVNIETQQKCIKAVLSYLDVNGNDDKILGPFVEPMLLSHFRNTLIGMLKLFSTEVDRLIPEIDTAIFNSINEASKKLIRNKLIITYDSCSTVQGHTMYYGWMGNPFSKKLELVQVIPNLKENPIRFMSQDEWFPKGDKESTLCWSMPKHFEELPTS